MNNSKQKIILAIVAFVLIAAIIGGAIWFAYDSKSCKEPSEDNTEQAFVTDGNGKEMSDGNVYAMPTAMTVSAAALSSSNTVDVRIEAYVLDYLTVTPDSDGSTLATVSCKKAFGNDKIIITVTTRDGGHSANCTVSFVGIASKMTVTSNSATQKNTAERGDYFDLGTDKTYTFNINLSNVFNSVGKSELSVSLLRSEQWHYKDRKRSET